MKIQEMVEWLEDKGFTVQKTYDSKYSHYEFVIERNGVKYADFYTYETGLKGKDIVAHQIRFLIKMTKRFGELETKEEERKREMNNKTTHGLSMAKYAQVMQKAAANGSEAVLEVDGTRMPIRFDNMTVGGDWISGDYIRFEGEVLVPDKVFEIDEYCKHDVESLYPQVMLATGRRNGKTLLQFKMYKKLMGLDNPFQIEKVIFNEPATIVIWGDGTKTVVKTQSGESYDPEKGLAMAITKKALGNKGNYFDTIKKWTKDYEKKDPEFDLSEVITFDTIKQARTVLNAMDDIIHNYGQATVADLYDLNAKEISYIANKYGWVDLHVKDSPSIIKLADDRFKLVLPKYVRID